MLGLALLPAPARAQITPGTVHELTLAFSFRIDQPGDYHGAPQPAGGLLLVQTPFPHALLALEPTRPDTPLRWRYAPAADMAAAGQDCCGTAFGAPVPAGGQVFLTTFDGHAIALQADSGRVLWDVKIADPGQGETLVAAPVLAGERLLVGSAGDDFGARGWLAALDPATGRTLWKRFNTGPDQEVGIGPEAGARDLGVATWPPQAWQQGGGGTRGLVYDPALNLLLHATGHAAPWNAEQRPGDNRWTAGLFARDPASGAVRWFAPVNPHDPYALGASAANLPVDMDWHGQQRRLLVHPDGNGRVYVLDRATGEQLSAAAFVPIDSKPLGVNTVARDICPGWPGATEGGAAAAGGLLYIPASLLCMDFEPRAANFMPGTPFMGANLRLKAEAGRSRGALIAWDIAAERPAWSVAERFPLAGGVLAAGGAVFYGTLDGQFKALDGRTGQMLWQFTAASGIVGQPVLYRGPDGRDYVAVLAGTGGAGAVTSDEIDVRDATAARGAANALRDLPPPADPAGWLYVFRLP